MNDKPRPRIQLDGVEYELPEELTMREAMLPYRYASAHGIVGDPPEICVLLATFHVAIARAKPGTPTSEIEERLLSIPVTKLQELAVQTEAASPNPPSGSSDGPGAPESVSSRRSGSSPDPSSPNGSGDPGSDSSEFAPLTSGI